MATLRISIKFDAVDNRMYRAMMELLHDLRTGDCKVYP